MTKPAERPVLSFLTSRVASTIFGCLLIMEVTKARKEGSRMIDLVAKFAGKHFKSSQYWSHWRIRGKNNESIIFPTGDELQKIFREALQSSRAGSEIRLESVSGEEMLVAMTPQLKGSVRYRLLMSLEACINNAISRAIS